MHITLVKKIKADGAPCRKCDEVIGRLESAGLMGRIHEVLIADERDAQSPGMRLAGRLGVDQAPFFVVRDESGAERVYTVYFRFVKEVLGGAVTEQEEVAELMDQNPGLDYI